jgi:hypothetical protein
MNNPIELGSPNMPPRVYKKTAANKVEEKRFRAALKTQSVKLLIGKLLLAGVSDNDQIANLVDEFIK